MNVAARSDNVKAAGHRFSATPDPEDGRWVERRMVEPDRGSLPDWRLSREVFLQYVFSKSATHAPTGTLQAHPIAMNIVCNWSVGSHSCATEPPIRDSINAVLRHLGGRSIHRRQFR